MDPDCHFGDHTWAGSSQCVRCGARLRCNCGVFIREDRMDTHLRRCPWLEEIRRNERREIEGSWPA